MLRTVLVSFVFVSFLAACGSGDGGVCQVNGDCQSGLVCCKLSTRLEDRGVCRPPGAVCAGASDASSVVDATRDTTASDTQLDAPTSDTAPEMSVSDSTADGTSDTQTDAPMADAATTDTANLSDAASDTQTD